MVQVMGYSDTDVAEYLYKKKPEINSLVNFLCNDLTEACSTKPPPVPKVTKLYNLRARFHASTIKNRNITSCFNIKFRNGGSI